MLRECLNRCKLKYQMHFTVCSNSGCTDIAVELGIVQKKKQNTLWKRITFPWQWIFHFLIFSVLFFTATSKIRFMHFCVMYMWLKKGMIFQKIENYAYHTTGNVWFFTKYICVLDFLSSTAQSTHTEWRRWLSGVHSIMMEKCTQAEWCGWGVHAHPLSLYLPSHTKLQWTLQLRWQILYTPPISSLTSFMYLW